MKTLIAVIESVLIQVSPLHSYQFKKSQLQKFVTQEFPEIIR